MQRLDKGWCQELELKPILFHENRTFCAKGSGRSGVTGGFSGKFCISLLIICELEAELNPGSLIVSAMQEAGEHGCLLGLSSQ